MLAVGPGYTEEEFGSTQGVLGKLWSPSSITHTFKAATYQKASFKYLVAKYGWFW